MTNRNRKKSCCDHLTCFYAPRVPRPAPYPRVMTDPIERIGAWLAALAVNALVIACLIEATPTFETQPMESQAAVLVVFLSTRPDPAEKLTPARRGTSPTRANATSPKKQARASAPTMTIDSIAVPVDAHEPVVGDSWSTPYASTPDEVERETFEPDLLRPRVSPMPATVDRMRLTFHDTSLVGRMKAMGRLSACRELKSALSANPASASAILATMHEYGCHKH